MRPPIATEETVQRAVDEILAEGGAVTGEAVREKLGGGSFSTINKLLREYRDRANQAQASQSKLPDGVAKIVQDAVARISVILEAESNARVDAVSISAAEAREKLNLELDEAIREVARLEKLLDASEIARKEAVQDCEQAELRESKASGHAREMEIRNESLTEKLTAIQADAKTDIALERDRARKAEAKAQAAIEEAAELRGQLKALSTAAVQKQSKATGKS